ncbi:MAG: hypothetical protein ACO1O1_00845 [Adhaeribacter sp.]
MANTYGYLPRKVTGKISIPRQKILQRFFAGIGCLKRRFPQMEQMTQIFQMPFEELAGIAWL